MLTVIQYDQRLLGAQPPHDVGDGAPIRGCAHPQRGRGDLGDIAGIVELGQLDQPHTVREAIHEHGRGLQRKPRLADTARADEGDQAVPGQHVGETVDVLRAAHEAGQERREVGGRRAQRPQRREGQRQTLGSHLQHPQRRGQVLQPVLAQIEQVPFRVEERGRDRGHQHLAPVGNGHQASRLVQHRSEIVALALVRLARMQAHPHPQLRPAPIRRRHRLLHGNGNGDGVPGSLECRPEPVATGVEYVPVMRLDDVDQDPVVTGQSEAHARAVLIPQPGRPFDIGE